MTKQVRVEIGKKCSARWCKAQQQDEEAEKYDEFDRPRRNAGEKGDDVREESDSLTDSSSETFFSLSCTGCGASTQWCYSVMRSPTQPFFVLRPCL